MAKLTEPKAERNRVESKEGGTEVKFGKTERKKLFYPCSMATYTRTVHGASEREVYLSNNKKGGRGR